MGKTRDCKRSLSSHRLYCRGFGQHNYGVTYPTAGNFERHSSEIDRRKS
jgi:hypothetical protein